LAGAALRFSPYVRFGEKVGVVTLNQYLFLSDEWLAESRKIREEYRDRVPRIPVTVRMNQIINEVPFGDGVIHAYVDTSSGQLDIETGQLESPDLTVSLNYETAKSILIDGDMQAAMNAFLGGRIKVDGDITKLLALQAGAAGGSPDAGAAELVGRIQAITL
jgi:SCP-2 sterol transfer family